MPSCKQEVDSVFDWTGALTGTMVTAVINHSICGQGKEGGALEVTENKLC